MPILPEPSVFQVSFYSSSGLEPIFVRIEGEGLTHMIPNRTLRLMVKTSNRIANSRVRRSKERKRTFDWLRLEDRAVPASIFIPAASDGSLIQAPVIESVNGVLSASVDMVRAGIPGSGESILYGNQPLYSNTKPEQPSFPGGPPYLPANFAAAYQFTTADGTVLPAQFPGATLKLKQGETLNLKISNSLANPNSAPEFPVERYLTNYHLHGALASPLADGDNVYRVMYPDGSYETSIKLSDLQSSGVNWYHVHKHGFSADQVYAGLAGMVQVGDPLDPWPEYVGNYEEKIMTVTMGLKVPTDNGLMLSDPKIQAGVGVYGTDWQVYVNGQYNPTTTMRPGETQIWTLGATVRNGTFNFGITDANGENPWQSTILSYDGNSNGLLPQPYTQVLPTDYVRDGRMVLDAGARITMAVTAPTTPGLYYLVDNATPGYKATDPFSVMTIRVEGDPVTEPAPVFGQTGPIPDVFDAPADHTRDIVWSQDSSGPGGTSAFKINGFTFPNGPMISLQAGQVEEWNLINVTGNDHVFHIHQLDFAVVEVNGIPIDTTGQGTYPYISLRDTINIPPRSTVTIKFRVTPFEGKYVMHCHILPHEDGGMMMSVISGPDMDERRVALGAGVGEGGGVLVQNGDEMQLGRLDPLPRSWKGGVATATGNLSGDLTQEIVAGAASRGFTSDVVVYDGTSLQETLRFKAFPEYPHAGVSLAIGDIDHDGLGEIIVGRVGPGPSLVRIFKADGTLFRELSGTVPGRLPNGVNVASADFDGDNYDDLAISAGRGSEPRVIGLNGFELGMTENWRVVKLFDFVAPGGRKAGARIAAGYADPSTVPSYAANLVTTAAAGSQNGKVFVWNVATPMNHGMSSMNASGMAEMALPEPMLMATLRPFRHRIPGGLRVAVGRLGFDGTPVVVSWASPHRVAYDTTQGGMSGGM
ncbi:multicopper oxidase domain-containing protein [bacterium]|nr:multicopper oxidase domain-containing protein [bacterium]